ncbi:hypothetical protein [Butyrivibrio sp. VCD2006]|uniref:hypothetical protein n=1 Tax=Butyrivibrio sp. VCD2006 TaxID=1280664 RepID=UPI0004086E3F|nr:hypothetical protein [Butyrivibrio sp. VCD2006]
MRIDGRGDAVLSKVYQEAITSPDKVQGVRPQQAPQPRGNEGAPVKETVSEEIKRTPRRNSNISDIKVSLGNRDDSLVGLSNLGGIQSNVMRKAVSDMQKDSVLHEYQYFVGSGAVNNRYMTKGSDVIMNDEDGLVVRK